MEVDHVETAPAHDALGPCRRRRRECDRRNRTVGPDVEGATDHRVRADVVGKVAVAVAVGRTQDRDLVPQAPQGA